MNTNTLCCICNLLPQSLTFDGIAVCSSCYTDNTHQFIEYADKRVPKYSIPINIDDYVFIGDEDSARNLDVLKANGITRILIAGSYLRAWHKDHFEYCQVPLHDQLEENIIRHLPEAMEFLFQNEAKGKVLVHCAAGVSRSGSIIIAYLMKKYKLSFDQALELAKSKSPRIHPNDSFVSQLKSWNPA